MALSFSRVGVNVLRRSIATSCCRQSSAPHPPADQHKGKVATKGTTMPDLLGNAVGKERFELLANLEGNDDPFEVKMFETKKGSFSEPTMVSSIMDERVVGCVCEEDAISINWMTLYRGQPKRCECGYWFKLKEIADPHL